MRRVLGLLLALGGWLAAEAPLPLPERIVQEAIAFAEVQAASLGGQPVLNLVQPPHVPPLRLKGGDLRIEAMALSKREPMGRFFVTIRLSEDGRPVGFTRVDLEGRWSGHVLKARESLARKTVPGEIQLESVPFEGVPPTGALTSFPGGYRLRQPVPAGRILTHADLEAIPLVAAGERIRLVAAWEELSISTEAIARSSGAAGDRVRLELPGSRKALVAVVSGPGEARLEWSRGRS